MRKLRESFVVNETLNPKIWDVDTNTLLPEVREKIVEIVSAFEEYLDAPIVIVDVQLVGSNASYNYNDKSDLDVHIIANFEQVTENTEILKALYDMKKSQFNKEFDITIHGIEIEMYIQDIKSGITSNGIFSVCDNTWIKEPKPIKSITKHNTEKELEKWNEKIDEVLASKDFDEIQNIINLMYLMRTNSIAVDGEYGKGNQIFKELRGQGRLKELKDALSKSMSKKLTLESLSRGQFISRFE